MSITSQKSLRTDILGLTNVAPLSTDTIVKAPTAGTNLVTPANGCTLAQLATLMGTLLNVTSGIYLPVASVLANLDAVTPNLNTQYLRVGNIVVVGGTFTADPTAASAASFRLTLPVATANFTATTQGGGVFTDDVTDFGQITVVSGAQLALFSFVPVTTAVHTYGFHFSYQIQ